MFDGRVQNLLLCAAHVSEGEAVKGMTELRGAGRLHRMVITTAGAAACLALVAGPLALRAAAAAAPVPTSHVTTGVTTSPSANSGIADCKTILAATPTAATKAFVTSTPNGQTITYFFRVTTTSKSTQTALEDCAYANNDPSNIKYEMFSSSPSFSGGETFTTLTVAAGDSICDRVAITNADGTTDYTNLVGSSKGLADPSACQTPPNVPEAPAAGLIALAGMGVAGAAVFVWRRRNADLAS